ncbi:YeiH family protein [Marinomonas mediterranea]|jgi:Predicted membrane protein|uniref:Uncharacterized protein family UPF0324 n=1 Tax=Marinomonas mediterranea (strain ATCC 700492 / JCM 21426 / NBRC 103028 / MMB-1) TaxID=717774 RepID=F2K2N3_MARM1|nr:putative sulfate exporter family transporter [Marinomonas mediterranea]ADZ90078.1 Uncharacterized protein family UPF0324 [Marinomonas mediterranea MMB-1]WCN08142.1 putative sulfate exporter family transporter [Marinomonas mediterranea]WCN12211.1 putative sulfate exporter family transporter [Marinomonas mediterranea]WCN16283.1 putative sulfate exporter family transporter [Marinomonas mediterranea MMB-1]
MLSNLHSLSSKNVQSLWNSYAPGLLLTTTIAVAAQFLGEHYGAPVMLFALLIGMAFNFLAHEPSCERGVQVSTSTILRIGVALLGVRISLEDFSSLGWINLSATVGLLIATILFGVLCAKALGERWQFGLLTGGAVAICGASAALALAAILPSNKQSGKETLFTVIAVTTLSTLAMISYPMIAQNLNLNELQTGFVLGATIHDVAQVVGAGYSISDSIGETATIVKLIRVSCLPIVLFIVLIIMKTKSNDSKISSSAITIPTFLIFFLLLATLNSFALLSEALIHIANEASRWLLVIAIAGLGVKTSLKSTFSLGKRQMGLIVIETLFLFIAAVLFVEWGLSA